MKILICGLGCSGKSTLRRWLDVMWRGALGQHDADNFKDRPSSEGCGGTIIEDVRATAAEEKPSVDFIFCVWAGSISYAIFWLKRACRWFLDGKFAWDRDSGWKGTGIVKDIRNIWPILREIQRALFTRKRWMDEDKKILQKWGIPYVMVRAVWKPGGILYRWDLCKMFCRFPR